MKKGQKLGQIIPNKVIYKDDIVAKILIESNMYGDKEVIIDREDLDRVLKHRWYLSFSKKESSWPHIKTNIIIDGKRKVDYLSRFVLEIKESIMVMYLDRNYLNNRKNNLSAQNKFVVKENEIISQDQNTTKFLIESPTHGNLEVLIDTEDWNKVKNYRWYVTYDSGCDSYYVKTSYAKNGKRIYKPLHRLLFDLEDPNIKVDHIDHNLLNNKRNNLRICTQEENARNKRQLPNSNLYNYKGCHYCYYKNKTNPWQCMIGHNNKTIHIGYFPTLEQCAKAYNKAAKKYFGEFACLNEI